MYELMLIDASILMLNHFVVFLPHLKCVEVLSIRFVNVLLVVLFFQVDDPTFNWIRTVSLMLVVQDYYMRDYREKNKKMLTREMSRFSRGCFNVQLKKPWMLIQTGS